MFFIGVCGGSCSGKTTFSHLLSKRFRNFGVETTIINLDNFYLSKNKRRVKNFDNPKSLDWNLLIKVLLSIREGNKFVEIPIYDMKIEDRVGSKKIRIGEVVIIEGLWVLYSRKLRNILDLKVFLDVDEDIRLIRRIIRDKRECGRSFTETLKRYFLFVKDGYRKYVLPFRKYADIIINNSKNEKILDMIVYYYLVKNKKNGKDKFCKFS